MDNAPLIVFRWLFGLMLFLETAGAIATGWVKKNLIEPTVQLPFIGFEWLQPLPGNGMYYYYALMALLGLLVMVGLYYRVSLGLFTLLWWGSYLMQKASYNNHYYLLLVLCFLMVLVPANAYASVDAKRNSNLRATTCPRWCLFIFVVQMGIVYTYAALAKISADWLAGLPVGIWFTAKSHFYVIGPLLAQKWFQWLVVYGGIAFDLLITPLLLWRRTRLFAFAVAIFFHGFNSAVFHIGIFPYLALGLCLFFFPPETIRQVFLRSKHPVDALEAQHGQTYPQSKFILAVLGLHFLLQIVLPLRPFFYPGNANWTEEGHRMSWHMMLRSKSGFAQFKVIADEKTFWESPSTHLTYKQQRSLATHPDLIWQFSQYLAQQYRAKGYKEVEVYAHSKVSLNGRPPQYLIDTTANLACTPWPYFAPAPWILPLQEE
ncbi:HTTM domain-containing protein [Rufibacter roseus]|uniref:HTTM domain-containing protein n=1 Tax=Rufibacter roseus TaxID=1567108 RepID=A0ABW2DFP7_9BACT|nr:HTTM domain-containing protein [Rufibacter roseus]